MYIKNTETEDAAKADRQRLFIQRFAMALATYAVVIFASFLVSSLGLSVLNKFQWAIYMGMAVSGAPSSTDRAGRTGKPSEVLRNRINETSPTPYIRPRLVFISYDIRIITV